ncbi:unnamed protein product [Boreogadus saida]
MGGPPEELRNGLLDDTRRQSSRTNSTRVVASTEAEREVEECPGGWREDSSGGTVERESGPVENNVYGTTSQGNCRYSPRKGDSTIHGLLSETCLELTKVIGTIPSPVDHSKVAKSATRIHASHCKRAPSPTTKVTSDRTPLAVTPTLKPG